METTMPVYVVELVAPFVNGSDRLERLLDEQKVGQKASLEDATCHLAAPSSMLGSAEASTASDLSCASSVDEDDDEEDSHLDRRAWGLVGSRLSSLFSNLLKTYEADGSDDGDDFMCRDQICSRDCPVTSRGSAWRSVPRGEDTIGDSSTDAGPSSRGRATRLCSSGLERSFDHDEVDGGHGVDMAVGSDDVNIAAWQNLGTRISASMQSHIDDLENDADDDRDASSTFLASRTCTNVRAANRRVVDTQRAECFAILNQYGVLGSSSWS